MLFILSYGDFRTQRPRGIAVFLINNIGNTASVSGFQCSNLSTLTFIIKRILIIWIHAAVSVINKSTGMTMGSAVDFSFDDNKKLKKIIISLCHRQNYRRFNPFSQKLISEISSSAVNGTHFIVSSHWKIPRKSGKSKKVAPFSWLKFPNGISCSIYTFLVVCISSRSTVGHRKVPGFMTKWNNFLPIGNSTFAPTKISGFFS